MTGSSPLVSLQTQEGVRGRGNYGIARMNKGFGNRSYVSLRPAGATVGTLFRHDLAILQAAGNELHATAGEIGLSTEEATALLWTVPWDGADSLPLSRLQPADSSEICRRVRLEHYEGGLRARVGNSKAARVAAKHLAGNLADPWTPVELSDEEAKALSVTREGFSYRRMSELLFGSSTRSWRPAGPRKTTRDRSHADGGCRDSAGTGERPKAYISEPWTFLLP